MIRLFTFLLLIIPLISFSQGQTKDYIDWLSLEKAQEYSKKYNKNINEDNMKRNGMTRHQ